MDDAAVAGDGGTSSGLGPVGIAGAARKLTMLACAFAVLLIGLATATAGAIGDMAIAKFVGYVLNLSGSYASIFAVAGGAYCIALLALHLLRPRLAGTRAGLDPIPTPETIA